MPPGSEATGIFPRRYCGSDENAFSRSMLSDETPMMLACTASNFSLFSAKACASMLQPPVNADERYTTTGPFCRAAWSENSNSLPASEALVEKSGALSPRFRAATAGRAQTVVSRAATSNRFIARFSFGRNVARTRRRRSKGRRRRDDQAGALFRASILARPRHLRSIGWQRRAGSVHAPGLGRAGAVQGHYSGRCTADGRSAPCRRCGS